MKEHSSKSVIPHLVIVCNCCSKVILHIWKRKRTSNINIRLLITIIRVKNANVFEIFTCLETSTNNTFQAGIQKFIHFTSKEIWTCPKIQTCLTGKLLSFVTRKMYHALI